LIVLQNSPGGILDGVVVLKWGGSGDMQGRCVCGEGWGYQWGAGPPKGWP